MSVITKCYLLFLNISLHADTISSHSIVRSNCFKLFKYISSNNVTGSKHVNITSSARRLFSHKLDEKL